MTIWGIVACYLYGFGDAVVNSSILWKRSLRSLLPSAAIGVRLDFELLIVESTSVRKGRESKKRWPQGFPFHRSFFFLPVLGLVFLMLVKSLPTFVSPTESVSRGL